MLLFLNLLGNARKKGIFPSPIPSIRKVSQVLGKDEQGAASAGRNAKEEETLYSRYVISSLYGNVLSGLHDNFRHGEEVCLLKIHRSLTSRRSPGLAFQRQVQRNQYIFLKSQGNVKRRLRRSLMGSDSIWEVNIL